MASSLPSIQRRFEFFSFSFFFLLPNSASDLTSAFGPRQRHQTELKTPFCGLSLTAWVHKASFSPWKCAFTVIVQTATPHIHLSPESRPGPSHLTYISHLSTQDLLLNKNEILRNRRKPHRLRNNNVNHPIPPPPPIPPPLNIPLTHKHSSAQDSPIQPCTFTTTKCLPLVATATVTVFEQPGTVTATSSFDCQGCQDIVTRNICGLGPVCYDSFSSSLRNRWSIY